LSLIFLYFLKLLEKRYGPRKRRIRVILGLTFAFRFGPFAEVDFSFPENISGENWFSGGFNSDGFRERGISTVMLESAFFGGIVRECFNVTTSRLGGVVLQLGLKLL
jgi:hypothetical protein